MEIEASVFGLLLLVALIVVAQAVKRRSDVLHGHYIESGFSFGGDRFAIRSGDADRS
jgi:hypothetical protein